MLKAVSATALALALMSGLAIAQDQQTTSQEKTTVQHPDGSQSFNANKTQTTTDGAGNQNTENKSYNRTDTPYGSQENKSTEQHTTSPDGSSSSTRQSTTNTKSPE